MVALCSVRSPVVDWGARTAVGRGVDAAGLAGGARVRSQGFVGRLLWSETPRRLLRWKNRRSQIDEESCSYSANLRKAHLTPSMVASQRLALASIFSPNTAEFVAAASSVLSIPRLAGLPEVKKMNSLYNPCLLNAHY